MITRTIHLSLLVLLLAALAWGCGGDEDASSNDCSGDGVWYDSTSNLCWQNPATNTTRSWSSSVYYCNGLDLGGHSDWRLPNVSELKSLLRGCVNGTATGDLSPSICELIPEGCAETDNCSGVSNCSWCSSGSGPASGCYWDPALSGTCGFYLSSSSRVHYAGSAWLVSFGSGYVGYGSKTYVYSARCVRGGPRSWPFGLIEGSEGVSLWIMKQRTGQEPVSPLSSHPRNSSLLTVSPRLARLFSS